MGGEVGDGSSTRLVWIHSRTARGCIENAPRVSDFVYRYRCRVDSGRMPAAATRETGDQCLPACRVSSVWSQDSVSDAGRTRYRMSVEG